MNGPPGDVMSFAVPIDDMSGAGEARRVAVKLAEVLGFGDADVGRVALVVTEAATNIVRYALHGEILLRRTALDAGVGVEILALDNGPGMASVAECMRDGFSTGGTRGVGIGAIARLSTIFDIISAPGKGTAILSRITVGPRQSPAPRLAWGAVCVPIRGEEVSGDAWAVDDAPGRSTILVVDGVGHGLNAFNAAQDALRLFQRTPAKGPESFLRALGDELRGSRGAAAMTIDINWTERKMRYAGVGNIAGTLLLEGKRSGGLVSHPGALGQTTGRVQEFTGQWPEKALLVVHSDGLSNRWDLESYPGLSQRDPSLIAGVLYRDFHTRNDDVVVLVCREREPGSREGM